MAEFCKIPDKCPAAKDCVKLNYRGSECAALRAAYDADYDPDDDAGEIVSAQFAPEGKTFQELTAMCIEYNTSVKNLQAKGMRNPEKLAFVEKVFKGGLTEFLCKRATEREKLSKEDLRYALEALDNAQDAIRALYE